MSRVERYRFQDFVWLDKDLDKTIHYLKRRTNKPIGLLLAKKNISAVQLEELFKNARDSIKLKALMLGDNFLGDEGCMVLRDYLVRDNDLVYLFLERNNITNKGLALLLEGMEGNRSLKSIWLGRNEIDDQGAEIFAEFLTTSGSRIKEFSIGGRLFTDIGAFHLARALKHSTSISSVHLLDSGISWEGGSILARVASINPTCDVIEIDSPHLRADEFAALISNQDYVEQKQSLLEALQNGEEASLFRCKIMVVGQGRAGKTATVRSLLNLGFNPSLLSTVVATVSQSTTKKTNGKNWEEDLGEHKVEMAVDAAARMAALKFRRKKRAQIEAFEQSSFEDMMRVMNESVRVEKEQVKAHLAKKKAMIPLNIQKEINHRYDATLVTNRSKHLDDIAFTIWDYGGQQVFQTLHHLFLTSFGIYLLVFDMRDTLSTVSQERRLEVRQYFKFWLSSISIHAPKAPVLVIGTFLDAIYKPEDILGVNLFLMEMLKTREEVNIVPNGNLCFFPLNNFNCKQNVRDLYRKVGGRIIHGESCVDCIRDSIEETARGLSFVQEKISIRWIKCLDMILGIKDKDFIFLEEAIELGQECGIAEEEEICRMLKFFHDIGMIVHLTSTEVLKKFVTIRPQWLLDELAKVIRDKDFHKFDQNSLASHGLQEDLLLMIRENIVTIDWLEFLWPKGRVDFLIDLMKQLLLISEWKVGSFSSERAYLVPSLLSTINEAAIREMGTVLVQFNSDGRLDGFFRPIRDARRFVFDFRQSHLPNGIFQRLLCLLLQTCPLGTSENPRLCLNSAVLDIGDGQVFELYIFEEQILCAVQKDFFASQNLLQRMLERIIQEVMSEALRWDSYVEVCNDEVGSQGYFHAFMRTDAARERGVSPWFDDVNSLENTNNIISAEYEAGLDDFLQEFGP